ncbi:MAG: methyltransferase [Bacteroidetes bacterium]|nr:methyltransferase [Bacteroidota bacterium]
MNSKERVFSSLNHRQPDRIAIDFGATPVTGIHVLAIERMREYYGLEKKPVRVVEPYQMLGEIDKELIDILGVDVIGLNPRNNIFGFQNDGDFKEFKTFWGQIVLVPKDFNTTLDSNGDLVIYPEGDVSVSPSGRMPKTGYFFDAIIRQEPLDESKLDSEDNLEEFSLLSEEDLDYWKQTVEGIKDSDKAILANMGGTAFGDIALVPGVNLKNPKGIRDIAEWYMSILMRPEYVHEIFEKQSEIALKNLQRFYSAVGDNIHILYMCGTDFGTQDGQFCDLYTLEELYVPYYKKLNNWIHENTNWKTFKHSCGAVEPFINTFIDAGFDILNPVQINASGMDPVQLKKNYGDRITFWGGGVDTQRVLSFGSAEDVKKQVVEQCHTLSKNGGFVFNTVHNIQANVPLGNIIAMLDSLKKFNEQ